MLLNYLYTNFYEENLFLEKANLKLDVLTEYIATRRLPKASYQIDANLKSFSFINESNLSENYSFHHKNNLLWLKSLQEEKLETEEQAKDYFKQSYHAAHRDFIESHLGRQVLAEDPTTRDYLIPEHFDETWHHFLNGVFGICTKQNLPDVIFIKQFLVRFIGRMIGHYSPSSIPEQSKERLQLAIRKLDQVEADFAPHEVVSTSRQRCIISVNQDYNLQIKLTKPMQSPCI